MLFQTIRAMRYRHRGTLRTLTVAATGVGAVGVVGSIALSQATSGYSSSTTNSPYEDYGGNFRYDSQVCEEGLVSTTIRTVTSSWKKIMATFSDDPIPSDFTTSSRQKKIFGENNDSLGGGFVSETASDAYSRPRKRPLNSLLHNNPAPVVSDLHTIISLQKRGDLSDAEFLHAKKLRLAQGCKDCEWIKEISKLVGFREAGYLT
eukprot:UC4_evm1s1338